VKQTLRQSDYATETYALLMHCNTRNVHKTTRQMGKAQNK